jgi:hypothetical protein
MPWSVQFTSRMYLAISLAPFVSRAPSSIADESGQNTQTPPARDDGGDDLLRPV